MNSDFARARALCAGLLLMLLGIAPVAAQIDLSASAVVSPVSGCALSASQNVTVRVFNFGVTLPAGSSFTMSYSINSAVPINEMVVLGSSFPLNSSLDYTFTAPANLSVPGTYFLDATVSVAGDINGSNDTLAGIGVTNTSSVAGTLSGPASGSTGTLTLGGQSAAIVQWEESPDGLRWFKLANTSSAQAYAGVTTPTSFRVRIANGSCPSVLSNVLVVNP